MPPTPTDKEYIKSQGFPDEALDDPTFIEAISRPVKQDYELDGFQGATKPSSQLS